MVISDVLIMMMGGQRSSRSGFIFMVTNERCRIVAELREATFAAKVVRLPARLCRPFRRPRVYCHSAHRIGDR